ncbi:MATE family efflux transporter [Wohlfahrtiimonas chitiniclastica]|uniref:MATE family efflux transporter n=1 Tax=Wohlfahrtiimonas chitiniclastica TaxID=400946 RepID=UPI0007B6999A|nr:MATE family efflux transporter [Wohlfahrtiimonas chitiniclastica]KZX38177.1 MATE family efflux transporter [Wohlfahrtiimonas chitiniclastica]
MSSSTHAVSERSLFSISWPIFIDIFLHLVTLLINTWMISHVSIQMVAATAASNQFFETSVAILNFIGVGCSIVVAQYLGAGDRETTRKAIHLSITLNLMLGFVTFLAIWFFGHDLLSVMNTPENILGMAYDYFHIIGICLIFEAVAIILASCLRVYGYSKAPMYVSLIMNIVTVVGNIFVLYGVFGFPQLGLSGVAGSTLLGRIVGVALLFYLLFFGIKVRLEWRMFFQFHKKILQQILKIGLPSAGENLSWTAQMLVMLAFVGKMGEDALAAHNIYLQLSYMLMLFALAIGIGNEILVGHLVGASNFNAASTRTWKSLRTGMLVTFAVVVVFYFARYLVVDSFTEDPIIKELLLPLFLLSILLEPGRTQNIVMVNALRATGDARFPFYAALVFMWGIAIPVGYYFGFVLEMGLIGIWIGFLCDEWIRGLVNAWRWKSRKWETKRLNIEH